MIFSDRKRQALGKQLLELNMVVKNALCGIGEEEKEREGEGERGRGRG